MVRRDIERIVNKISANSTLSNVDVLLMYDLIFNYCKRKRTSPDNNTYSLDNGVLVINGEHIERVCPLIKPFNTYDKKADYYESLCIKDYD